MKTLINKYLRFCPKTGRFIGFREQRGISRLLFPLAGLVALAWILIRVIPKPSRASYPCVQTAAPIASSFLVYITAMFSSLFFFKKAKKYLYESRIAFFSLCSVLGLFFGVTAYMQTNENAYARYQTALEGANQPMGEGKGVFPGRVVWVRDSTAVDQQCTNSTGDYWWQDDNTDQTAVNSMVSDAIRTLAGKESDSEAWDAIFRSYNKAHGKGDVGYTAGEKIVIKLNLNTGASGSDYTRADNRTIDTSPQVICAVLDQLVNHAGVAQAAIGFGDPGRNVDNVFWNKFHQLFPDVKYWGAGSGRTPIVQSSSQVFFTSDGLQEHFMPNCYIEAAYMINIPVLKQHHRAGISLASKNHVGTFVPFLPQWDALHYSFPCSQGDGNVDNGDYHLYRLFVDFMGHKDLGGKTILYLVDGLWSSTNYGDPPWKWRMAPFNNKYPASIFASQDPVALESVGFDFLYAEFYVGNPSNNAFPRYAGVDDFLHQAADSVNWPAEIKYDPENDGTYLPRSMGVHEHWNNAAERKYSKNLGTGEGIELIERGTLTAVTGSNNEQRPEQFELFANYPNPFNPATTISYSLPEQSSVEVTIYDMQGREMKSFIYSARSAGVQKVRWDGKNNQGRTVSSGTYLCRVKATSLNSGKAFEKSVKMTLVK